MAAITQRTYAAENGNLFSVPAFGIKFLIFAPTTSCGWRHGIFVCFPPMHEPASRD
jgi:hypothetical protein